MSVVEALDQELRTLGDKARGSTLAATAMALARELDDAVAEEECQECGHVQSWTVGHNSATSKSMCATSLANVMRELRALAPPKKETDGVDDLASRRAERRAAATSVARP